MKTDVQLMTDELPVGPAEFTENMIKSTHEIILEMTEIQKFAKARAHIFDALKQKHPRHESESLSTPRLFKNLYKIQSSSLWEWMLFTAGWVFLCLAAIDSQSYSIKIGMEATCLLLFWIDTFILLYCKAFDNFQKANHFSRLFSFRIAINALMTVDLMVFIILPCYDSRPIRPFRILRCFVPLLFDAEMRKSLLSLASAYKDILAFFVFFTIVLVGYALIGNRTLGFNPNYIPDVLDPYKTNYRSLSFMIFMVYATATDNHTRAIQTYEPSYIYFTVFIIFNMFLFSPIPSSLIYVKFRNARSKILLVDEIRQQHSLVLAFVTLAENEANLHMDKLIKFLLYLYRYKIRYVQYITDICLRLNENNKHSIQVNDFMQLAKLFLENSAMFPPTFDDIEIWIRFRKYLNKTFKLKLIVKHLMFELVVSILIVLSFINALFFMYRHNRLVEIFDSIFIWIFFVELMARIIAIGPEVFFMDRWNKVDTFLVALGLFFFFVLDNFNADGIIRMGRIFRLASLLRLMSRNKIMEGVKFQVWRKIKNIFSIMLEIVPIILKFMNLFAFFFYVYIIFGMEVFYNFYGKGIESNPSYNGFQQFFTFESFAKGIYVMVQILVEATWSTIAHDYCWRAPYYYNYIMLFFCFCHITIVCVVATLIKGIFWEIFFTVNEIFESRQRSNTEEEVKEQAYNKKMKEIQEINSLIQQNKYLSPDTILKRGLIEDKLDEQIFKSLIKYHESQKKANSNKEFKQKKPLIVVRQYSEWDMMRRGNRKTKFSPKKKLAESRQLGEKRQKVTLNEIQEMEEDFQGGVSKIIGRLTINPKIKQNEIIATPKIFVEFLQSKLKNPNQFIKQTEFNMHFSPFHNQESIYCHIYQLHSILGIDASKRQQKALIIKNLIEEGILTEEQGELLLRKTLQEKVFKIDSNGALRQMFLLGTNEQLVKKFEIEYFSDVYGYSYKRINKLTLRPLLSCEATLTYALRNILRYPQINGVEFFEMLAHIQDQFSNKLLKTGSLFKFVYKLDSEGDIWFSVVYNRQQQIKIHFIKTGIWCYHKDMAEKQVVYARDIFHWNFPEEDREACKHHIKRFYQNFEGLAFSLIHEQQFFNTDPKDYVYDLYLQHFNVDRIARFQTRKLEISKIMVVILSKEEEREDIGIRRLDYKLSDIKIDHKKTKKKMDFRFDESDNETFEKLKNLAAVQVDKRVESQGLPFSYVINLMKEISDTVTTNESNFVYQIEKALNEEYQEMREEFHQRR